MKTKMTMLLFTWVLFLAGMLTSPSTSEAGVNISLGIQLPALAIAAPPAMVAIPGTYAYYAPDVEAGLFFSHGSWYRPYQGGWYVSVAFNGPWGSVAVENVPSAIVGFSREGHESREGHPLYGRGRGMGIMGMGMGMGMR